MLTDVAIRKAKPTDKRYSLYDTGGLSLEVMLNTLGYRADVIEAALAHIQGGVRGVYNRSDYWEERRAMMQEWADWLDGLLTSVEILK